jgi:hypothetical protein
VARMTGRARLGGACGRKRGGDGAHVTGRRAQLGGGRRGRGMSASSRSVVGPGRPSRERTTRSLALSTISLDYLVI